MAILPELRPSASVGQGIGRFTPCARDGPTERSGMDVLSDPPGPDDRHPVDLDVRTAGQRVELERNLVPSAKERVPSDAKEEHPGFDLLVHRDSSTFRVEPDTEEPRLVLPVPRPTELTV